MRPSPLFTLPASARVATRIPARVRVQGAWLGALVLGLTCSSCGKPATEADCERIVARVTELELKQANVSDPVQIQAQVDEAKRSFRDRAQKECVGRRLSKDTLDCVANATEAKQIVEECF